MKRNMFWLVPLLAGFTGMIHFMQLVISKKMYIKREHSDFVCIFASVAVATACLAATPYQTAEWVGSNYTPAYAVNQIQLWHEFNPEVIEKELAAGKKYFGINTLRVFLHNIPYDSEKKKFLANIEQFLTICQRQGIRPGFTFFDDCWNHKGVTLESPPPIKGRHNGRWAACPQDVERDEKNLPKLKAYVQDVIRAHRQDQRVLWWEIFNEPNDSDYTARLRKLGCQWAKEVQPMQPVICCWNDNSETDIVNTHNYTTDFAAWDEQADRNPAKGCVFTEAGARSTAGEPCSVIHWLQQRKKTNIYVPGVYLCWELMVGNSNCRWYWDTKDGAAEMTIPWSGLMWPDCTPVSLAEAEAIRQYATGQRHAMFFENFQHVTSPDGWTTYGMTGCSGSGIWQLGANQKMVAGDAKWSDYVLEGMVMLKANTGNAGLVFRASHPGAGPDQLRGYYVGFDTKTLYLGKMNNNWQLLASYDLAKLECKVAPGVWNQIRVAMEGPRICVWFNRMHPSADKDAGLRIDVIDRKNPVLAGKIGVRTSGVEASFDNIVVLPIDALPEVAR